MIRKIAPVGLLLLVFAGTASSETGDWARVTTWEGQEIMLANYGFYESSNWDRLADFRVDRAAVNVVYGGARSEIRLDRIRSLSQDPPLFAEAFRGVVVELVDGTRIRCELAPEVSGLAGNDQIGEVRVPGRKIRSIEFVRPGAKEGEEGGAR